MSVNKFFKICSICRLYQNDTIARIIQPTKNIVYNSIQHIIRNSLKGYLIVGREVINPSEYGGDDDFYLVFTDNNLNVINKTSLFSTAGIFPYKVRELPPNKYILEYENLQSEQAIALFSEESIETSSNLTFQNILKKDTSSNVEIDSFSAFGTNKEEIIVATIYTNESGETKLVIMVLDKNGNISKQVGYTLNIGNSTTPYFVERLKFLETQNYYFLIGNYEGLSVITRIDKETKELVAKGLESPILDSDVDKEGNLHILNGNFSVNYTKLDQDLNVLDNVTIFGGTTHQLKILDNGTVLMVMKTYDPNSDMEVSLLFDATKIRNVTKFKVFEEATIFLEDIASEDLFTASFEVVKNYENSYYFTGVFEYNKLDKIDSARLNTTEAELADTLRCYTMVNEPDSEDDSLAVIVVDSDSAPRFIDLTETNSNDCPLVPDNTTFDIPLIKGDLALYGCKEV